MSFSNVVNSGVFDTEKELSKLEMNGGWGNNNSVAPLMNFFNNWNIPMEVPCEEIGDNTRTTYKMYKCELRVLLNLVKNDKLTMVHELFAWGKDPNKKAAKGKCAGSI